MRRFSKLISASKIGVLCGFLMSTPFTATAALIMSSDFDESDCAGFFGDNFDSCTVFINNESGERIELSPVIAKFGFDDGVGPTETEINPLFPSVNGDEFTITFDSGSDSAGSWTYTQGAGDPSVKYWATKTGGGAGGEQDFKLFWVIDDDDETATCDSDNTGQTNYNLACLEAALVVNTSTFSTIDDKALSHITFYDTGGTPIPEPSTLLLLGSGLFSLAFWRKSKSRNSRGRAE